MAIQGDLHVVLGARGGVGQVLVRMLAEQGQRVRAVNRSGIAEAPESVELAAADLMQRARPAVWQWPSPSRRSRG